ncbi:hypothetical protein BDN71DRAFT_1435004 [Pleurotus eryngii]|uniref:Uncharacterized protein n=1 Tax=Pleurotus eryngii TaxID=5323 RepID=A0A9P5ZQD2_PLEER|nr:hypothetical protein BDN71DRAFT_1435004 [Pleurotus eryngii]
MISLETNEMGEDGPLVASPSKAKPRNGSMALQKAEIVERNLCGMSCMPSLGLSNGKFELGCCCCLRAKAETGGHTGAHRVANVYTGDQSADGQHGATHRRPCRAKEQAGVSGGGLSQGQMNTGLQMGAMPFTHSIAPIATELVQPAITMPMPPALLPPLLPNMPPPLLAVPPPCTPLPAPHHPLSPSQAPASPSTLPPHSLSPTQSPPLASPSQTRATSKDVNMDLSSLPTAAALIVTVQEATPCPNTALANLSHALAQLQVPPPQMTRVWLATLIEPLSRQPKQKATGRAVANTKHMKE